MLSWLTGKSDEAQASPPAAQRACNRKSRGTRKKASAEPEPLQQNNNTGHEVDQFAGRGATATATGNKRLKANSLALEGVVDLDFVVVDAAPLRRATLLARGYYVAHHGSENESLVSVSSEKQNFHLVLRRRPTPGPGVPASCS